MRKFFLRCLHAMRQRLRLLLRRRFLAFGDKCDWKETKFRNRALIFPGRRFYADDSDEVIVSWVALDNAAKFPSARRKILVAKQDKLTDLSEILRRLPFWALVQRMQEAWNW
ncbi:uncharacterized protein LOC117606159 isoform X1 [Osmia lignaria lignaria]|uniref:uncharacterized protein LOC117611128 isoform X1 n=1 Tax=Osmia lignaria TaxID=473952 RepID=UPI0014780946|nr:uncharacterized protein LOC117611128 isoform X1 [Osmia lignaria]